MNNPNRTHLGCEPLEARENPAGNVSAFITNGTLFLIGDGNAAGNQVKVWQDSAGRVFATPQGGTTVNGSLNRVFLGQGNPNRVSVQFNGAGADYAEVSTMTVGSVDVVTGAGNDVINLNRLSAGAVFVDAGNGDDRISLRTVSTVNNGTVSGGAGFDTLYYGQLFRPPFYNSMERVQQVS